MAKKMEILLEYPVQTIEWIAQDSKAHQLSTLKSDFGSGDAHRRSRQLIMPNFLITYVDQAFIDYFNEKGSLLHRVDLSAVFEAYEDLEMIKLDQIKLPKLVWSCRSLNMLPKQMASSQNIQMSEKFIISGQCNYKGSERPFLAKLNVTFSIPDVVTGKKQKQEIKVDSEVIKVIGGEDFDTITAIEFGPYDNGYILAGM